MTTISTAMDRAAADFEQAREVLAWRDNIWRRVFAATADDILGDHPHVAGALAAADTVLRGTAGIVEISAARKTAERLTGLLELDRAVRDLG